MRYIYCHPLFDERKCAHRFSYELKKAFASAGLLLERLDYRGTAEAIGEFSEITLQSLREDVARCVKDDEVHLCGLRFGASLAFDFCVRCPGIVKTLVLLEPVVIGSAYIDYLYRKQRVKDLMTSQSNDESSEAGYRNLGGYKTSLLYKDQTRLVPA